ncbi:MAG: hypothetical protein IT371_01315 [Deltaproteobacteria bacterium]|nr:hypothetical protein [Deltaproteobacteria bacterium]
MYRRDRALGVRAGGRLPTTIVMAALSLAPTLAGAQPELVTGQTHLVQVSPAPTGGLEAGIPRSGWYARATELDLRSQWEESYQAYQRARDEFRQLLVERPQLQRLLDGWVAKAEFQMDLSRNLQSNATYLALAAYIPASTRYYWAEHKHNKWLAIRAFTGQSHARLLAEVLADYQRVIAQSPTYYYVQLARLSLAALLHETGQRQRGWQEFSRLSHPLPSWLDVQLAHYYVAAGHLERGFRTLQRVSTHNRYGLAHIFRSNQFDPLRTDPRFQRLLAAP